MIYVLIHHYTAMYIYMMQKVGITALAWASLQDHDQIVDVLLKAGADPDIQDKVAKVWCVCIRIVSQCLRYIPWPL